MTNLVELIADPGNSAFDQPCRYGHRVEDHAVYCHNPDWPMAPRKCRRSWYTRNDKTPERDEECPGFEPNIMLEAGDD